MLASLAARASASARLFSSSTSSSPLLRRSVLVLNAGSSSLKLKLFEEAAEGERDVTEEPLLVPVASALVERLGTDEATLRSWRKGGGKGSQGGSGESGGGGGQKMGAAERVSAGDVRAALSAALPRLGLSTSSSSSSPRRQLTAVGNRIVHGGELSEPRDWRDAATRAAVSAATALAPLHNPSGAAGADAALEAFPEALAHVAVFDTAFHVASMGAEAFTYALPASMRSLSSSSSPSSSSSSSSCSPPFPLPPYAAAASIPLRKYGFHGSSFKHAVSAASRLLGLPPTPGEEGALDAIAFHLGAGASAAAIHRGRSVDTSLGATPLQGLVMATRCGDVDPAVPLLLAAERGRDAEGVLRALNRDAGLAALAGPGVAPSGDMRDVIAAAEREEREEEEEEEFGEGAKATRNSSGARLALDVYVHRIRHYLGAFLLGRHLNGRAHAIIFTGGVGENCPLVRARALEGLEHLGIEVDERLNAAAVGCREEALRIDTGRGARSIAVAVVPADEEGVIAREAWRVAMRGAERGGGGERR